VVLIHLKAMFKIAPLAHELEMSSALVGSFIQGSSCDLAPSWEMLSKL
jgi:hypothetical protein